MYEPNHKELINFQYTLSVGSSVLNFADMHFLLQFVKQYYQNAFQKIWIL